MINVLVIVNTYAECKKYSRNTKHFFPKLKWWDSERLENDKFNIHFVDKKRFLVGTKSETQDLIINLSDLADKELEEMKICLLPMIRWQE